MIKTCWLFSFSVYEITDKRSQRMCTLTCIQAVVIDWNMIDIGMIRAQFCPAMTVTRSYVWSLVSIIIVSPLFCIFIFVLPTRLSIDYSELNSKSFLNLISIDTFIKLLNLFVLHVYTVGCNTFTRHACTCWLALKPHWHHVVTAEACITCQSRSM